MRNQVGLVSDYVSRADPISRGFKVQLKRRDRDLIFRVAVEICFDLAFLNIIL